MNYNLFLFSECKIHTHICGVSVPKFVKNPSSFQFYQEIKWLKVICYVQEIFFCFCRFLLPFSSEILYHIIRRFYDDNRSTRILVICIFCLLLDFFLVMVVEWIRLPSFLYVASLTLWPCIIIWKHHTFMN